MSAKRQGMYVLPHLEENKKHANRISHQRYDNA